VVVQLMQEGCVSLLCLLPRINYGLCTESNESANEANAREVMLHWHLGGMVKSPVALPWDCVIVLNKTAMRTQRELDVGNVLSLHQRANSHQLICVIECVGLTATFVGRNASVK